MSVVEASDQAVSQIMSSVIQESSSVMESSSVVEESSSIIEGSSASIMESKQKAFAMTKKMSELRSESFSSSREEVMEGSSISSMMLKDGLMKQLAEKCGTETSSSIQSMQSSMSNFMKSSMRHASIEESSEVFKSVQNIKQESVSQSEVVQESSVMESSEMSSKSSSMMKKFSFSSQSEEVVKESSTMQEMGRIEMEQDQPEIVLKYDLGNSTGDVNIIVQQLKDGLSIEGLNDGLVVKILNGSGDELSQNGSQVFEINNQMMQDQQQKQHMMAKSKQTMADQSLNQSHIRKQAAGLKEGEVEIPVEGAGKDYTGQDFQVICRVNGGEKVIEVTGRENDGSRPTPPEGLNKTIPLPADVDVLNIKAFMTPESNRINFKMPKLAQYEMDSTQAQQKLAMNEKMMATF